VLFVGTKKQAQEPVAEQAARVGMPYVNQRWLGGMLTNFQTVNKRLQRLKELEEVDFDDVAGSSFTKKELLIMRRERDKLAKTLGGIRDMSRVPAAVWIVDTNKEHLAVNEARKLGVPVVAILDTNCDPDMVDYAIPGNDDAIRAVALLTRVVADAVAEGLIARHTARTGEEATAAPETEPLAEWERELLAGSAAAAPATAAAAVVASPAEAAPVEPAVVPEPAPVAPEVVPEAEVVAAPEAEVVAAPEAEAEVAAAPEPEAEAEVAAAPEAEAEVAAAPEPEAEPEPEPEVAPEPEPEVAPEPEPEVVPEPKPSDDATSN
jgi:small subunit ribosomal protein S2